MATALVARDTENRNSPDRSSLRLLWEDIARYLLPREARFTEETVSGILRSRELLDSTGARALELFASFLHTLLNNPSTQWIDIGLLGQTDSALSNTAVKRWLEEVSNITMGAVSGPLSTLYADLHTAYLFLGAFGTAVLYAEDGGNGLVRTRHFHLEDVTIEEDVSGFIDVVLRKSKFNKRQIQQRWPGVPPSAFGASLMKDERRQGIDILHAVFPTSDAAMTEHMTKQQLGVVKNFPYASVWVNAVDSVTISVGGFEEFPYVVPRWYKDRSSPYGRSPGMTVHPDVRMTNRMMETILRGAEKLVDPPLVLRAGSLISPLRLAPGGLTFSDTDVKPEPLIPPGASRIEYGQALLRSRQDAIREGFFTPLFATPESPIKTATQVLQEADERNRAIAPMLIRMYQELFHRLVARIFGILSRAGAYPPPPGEIANAELSVRYVSPLVASHRQVEALGALRTAEGILPWAQADPSVLDNFNTDAIAEVVHAGSAAPMKILNTPAKIKDIRKQREEQELSLIHISEPTRPY